MISRPALQLAGYCGPECEPPSLVQWSQPPVKGVRDPTLFTNVYGFGASTIIMGQFFEKEKKSIDNLTVELKGDHQESLPGRSWISQGQRWSSSGSPRELLKTLNHIKNAVHGSPLSKPSFNFSKNCRIPSCCNDSRRVASLLGMAVSTPHQLKLIYVYRIFRSRALFPNT